MQTYKISSIYVDVKKFTCVKAHELSCGNLFSECSICLNIFFLQIVFVHNLFRYELNQIGRIFKRHQKRFGTNKN